jgi:hypothetical protein
MTSTETTVTGTTLSINHSYSHRTRFGICLLIFLTACGVRFLVWHDTRLEVGKVQTAVTADYQRVAQLFRQGGVGSFLSSSSPLSDLNTLGHPPGYSILLAGTFSVFGESNTAIQFVQIICDALAAVMIFLIVAELLPLSAAVVAGMLAAFSPQFAWNSVLLLPDSLAVLPILLAIYCLVRAVRKPRLLTFLITGALIGLSCWLRANAMFLTFFIALAVLLLRVRSPTVREGPFHQPALSNGRASNTLIHIKSERRWRFALAVVCGTLLIVLPLTIRNAIVFRRFIPLSLGAGQTLLEGIADYDSQGRFGIPNTDVGIMKQEAEQSQRPEYYGTLFNPDGVERERARLSRGFAVIRSHPFWFAGVMARRAGSMLRLERSRLVSTQPPVSHSLDAVNRLQPVGARVPSDLLAAGRLSQNAIAFPGPEDGALVLKGNTEKSGEQLVSGSLTVKRDNDYVFTVPIKIEQGRIRISVINGAGKIYASTIAETLEHTAPEEQPQNLAVLPFVSVKDEEIHLTFANEASIPANPIVRIGTIKLFELGPARARWTRYPRLIVHGIQSLFLTAVILPLAIIGLMLLIWRQRRTVLVVLLVVPVYFFLVQSIVHTEYRYVLAVDYFLFALAGVTVSWMADLVIARIASLRRRST